MAKHRGKNRRSRRHPACLSAATQNGWENKAGGRRREKQGRGAVWWKRLLTILVICIVVLGVVLGMDALLRHIGIDPVIGTVRGIGVQGRGGRGRLAGATVSIGSLLFWVPLVGGFVWMIVSAGGFRDHRKAHRRDIVQKWQYWRKMGGKRAKK